MRDFSFNFSNKRIYYLIGIILTFLVLLAWMHRFIQDDAFISFRYAYNLAEGKGLVWNEGERVEGYTNFLWTLLISSGIYLKIDPVTFSTLLGLFFFAISLFFTFKLGMVIFESPLPSLVTMILVGTNYTFLSFATGGLETQMQTALFTIGCYNCLEGIKIHEWSVKRLLSLSIIMGLSLLTRLDSLIMCAVLLLITVYHINRDTIALKEKISKHLILFIPFILLITPWIFWKLSYYGNLLPNTYYIKVAGITSLERGIKYVYLFFKTYLLIPFWFLFFFAIRQLFNKNSMHLHVLISIIILWLFYIIKIGGDFMEFRFFVPILPLIFILLNWLIFIFLKTEFLKIISICLIITGSIYHSQTFKLNEKDRIEPISELQSHILNRDQNWKGIGEFLGGVFGKKDVSIATTAAGAIPYFSGLPTIDMYGINDPHIVQKGIVIGTTPGHQIISPFSYLVEKKVNLIISHPVIIPKSEEASYFPELPMNPNDVPVDLKIIEISFDSLYKFLAYYLTPHPAIDEAIIKHNWKVKSFASR
mgnify:CR=1 FL=1